MKINRQRPKRGAGSLPRSPFTPAVLAKVRREAGMVGGSRWKAYATVAKKLRGAETVDLAAAFEGYGKLVDLLDYTKIGASVANATGAERNRRALRELGDELIRVLIKQLDSEDRQKVREALQWHL